VGIEDDEMSDLPPNSGATPEPTGDLPTSALSAAQPLTVAQAKANLLAQGERGQREIEAFIDRVRGEVQEKIAGVRKAAPWAAAAALAAGFVVGKRRRRRSGRGMQGGSGDDADARRGEQSVTSMGVKWAVTTLAPIAIRALRRAAAARAAKRSQADQAGEG
jgi:hypothetical protein